MHIGEKIRAVYKESPLSVAEFARRIGTSRENMYAIFKRKSVDSDLLLKISQVLDHDFFFYLIDKGKYNSLINEKQEALKIAEKEIAYLKKINGLLEQEIARGKKNGSGRK